MFHDKAMDENVASSDFLQEYQAGGVVQETRQVFRDIPLTIQNISKNEVAQDRCAVPQPDSHTNKTKKNQITGYCFVPSGRVREPGHEEQWSTNKQCAN